MERERINPPSLFNHPAFTRVVTVKGPCKFIFIAGLTAADINYKCVAPGDCRAQYIQHTGELDGPAQSRWCHLG